MNLSKSDRMSKEKQKFFRLSAFNCDRAASGAALASHQQMLMAELGQQPSLMVASNATSNSHKRWKGSDPNHIRLGVKVSKLSDTSDDEDDANGNSINNKQDSPMKSVLGHQSNAIKQEKSNGKVHERLSDSSSSCSSSDDSSSSSDSCTDDSSEDSKDDDDDSSSVSSNTTVSSSYEPETEDGKPTEKTAGPTSGSGALGENSTFGTALYNNNHNHNTNNNNNNNGSRRTTTQRQQTNVTVQSRNFTHRFNELETGGESLEPEGVWGFAAEAKKNSEIFSKTPKTAREQQRIFGTFDSGQSKSSVVRDESRGRAPFQNLPTSPNTGGRRVLKETRNTYNRDFSSASSSSSTRMITNQKTGPTTPNSSAGDSNNNSKRHKTHLSPSGLVKSAVNSKQRELEERNKSLRGDNKLYGFCSDVTSPKEDPHRAPFMGNFTDNNPTFASTMGGSAQVGSSRHGGGSLSTPTTSSYSSPPYSISNQNSSGKENNGPKYKY